MFFERFEKCLSLLSLPLSPSLFLRNTSLTRQNFTTSPISIRQKPRMMDARWTAVCTSQNFIERTAAALISAFSVAKSKCSDITFLCRIFKSALFSRNYRAVNFRACVSSQNFQLIPALHDTLLSIKSSLSRCIKSS